VGPRHTLPSRRKLLGRPLRKPTRPTHCISSLPRTSSPRPTTTH
jgi:hypothetical protein